MACLRAAAACAAALAAQNAHALQLYVNLSTLRLRSCKLPGFTSAQQQLWLARVLQGLQLTVAAMVQSLHTTVLPIGTTQDLFPVEVQIRTSDMHREAEFGIAGEPHASCLLPMGA